MRYSDVYVRIFLFINIFTMLACSDTASDTSNPDIGSLNAPTFIITDSGGDVSEPPSISLIENTQISTDLTLLAEDKDGDSINWRISTEPTKGTVVLGGNSSLDTSKIISYSPKVEASGADSFVVTIDDGTGLSNSVTVNVSIVFTVSVAVSGYTTGNAMALQINGKDDLVILKDGTYTFSDALNSGDTYEISSTPSAILKTSCLFNNASGTITSSNVTNVAVICTDDIAPEIVSVTPAAGAMDIALDAEIRVVFDEDIFATSIGTDAIVLSDSLGPVAGTVNYNVSNRRLSIVPTEPLALLRSYTVTLSSEITDISGKAIVSNPWTFTTRDGVWGTSGIIDTNGQGIFRFSPKIALNSGGQGIAVWEQADGTRSIWANRFDSVTKVWAVAEAIENDDQGNAFSPQIAINSVGQGIAVWRRIVDPGTQYFIWANHFDNISNTWGEAEPIGDINGFASPPQVVLDSEGHGLAVWDQPDSAGRVSVWANRFDFVTKTWGVAGTIESDNRGDASSPKITMNSAGEGLAVWRQSDGTRFNIWANHFVSATKTWGNAKLIGDNQGPAFLPQVAMNSAGQGIAVWFQNDDTGRSNIWANRFDSVTKTWGTAELIGNNQGHARDPEVAMSLAGQGIAVWRQSDSDISGRYSIWANRFDSVTNMWGNAELIENNDERNAELPKIALDSLGHGLAVWDQFNISTGKFNILANRFDSFTKSWGRVRLIGPDNIGSTFPQISLDSLGRGIAVWSQSPDYGENRFE